MEQGSFCNVPEAAQIVRPWYRASAFDLEQEQADVDPIPDPPVQTTGSSVLNAIAGIQTP